ncbi:MULTISPECIES: TIGR02444 family protein [unclassified Brevundimonas]|uniref:TIGR02444 family protein n=1 Tax=unclassified Brevundimonas TaxID=2622653 RepID=UPI0025B9C1B7|nr:MULTISPECIES: TIGR02444 family protein [unclassified Brevundimonas]
MSDLWTWAVAAYDAPGVAEVCLSLQDHNEQNVPLMLWAAWVAVTGRRPDEETIEAACDAARAYDTVVVAPLRALRRTLKAPIPDVDNEHREALRQQVKALELDAERRLMLELEALAPAPSGAPRRALDGLAETAKLWARVVPRPALTTLADRLPA